MTPTTDGPGFVLLNPAAAGGRAARLAPRIEDHLRRNAPTVSLHQSSSVDQALALLQAWPSGSRVVLAGGDGTLHRMLPAVLARGHRLGLLPCGTGNDTARAFGVHRLGWADALDFALQGQAQATDVGEVQSEGRDTPFVSSLAAGFDAAVAQRALRAPPWLRGMPRYLHATLAEMAALRRFEIQVWADGVDIHHGDTLFASTLNTRSYGSGMPVAPDADIADGRLDLVIAGRFGRVGALAMMPLLMAGLHTRHPRVALHSFKHLRIKALPALPLAADGEPLPDATEVQVRVRAGALWAVRKLA